MRPLNDRGDRVLEALLSLAFFDDEARRMPSLSGPEPELDPADREALEALGPDLVRRVLEGDDDPCDPSGESRPPDPPHPPGASF